MWVVGSTPIECARSREAVRRSELAGWAEYGYCASHSRYSWGLRLHLIATLHGLPVSVAVSGAEADERQVLLDLLGTDPALIPSHRGQILGTDKHYYSRRLEAELADAGLTLLPAPAVVNLTDPARHLCSVTNLWPLQESQRIGAAHWLPADLPDLLAAAAEVPAFTAVVSRPRLHVTAAQRGGRVAVHHPLKGFLGLIGLPGRPPTTGCAVAGWEVDAVAIIRVVRRDGRSRRHDGEQGRLPRTHFQFRQPLSQS